MVRGITSRARSQQRGKKGSGPVPLSAAQPAAAHPDTTGHPGPPFTIRINTGDIGECRTKGIVEDRKGTQCTGARHRTHRMHN